MTRERTPQEHRARHLARHARRHQRWREQAARLVSLAMKSEHPPAWYGMLAGIVRPVHFNVALVRTYCERLIAEADDLDMQREVFTDWTRARGKGPENRARGAFVPVRAETPWVVSTAENDEEGTIEFRIAGDARSVWVPMDADAPYIAALINEARIGLIASVDSRDTLTLTLDTTDLRNAPRGGWPGNLAREYVAEQAAKRKCPRKDCDGGRIVFACTDCGGHGCDVCSESGRCWYTCPDCEATSSTRPSRAFVNGGNMRRAAQRLLDTLDGRCPWNADAVSQPSECRCCADIRRVNAPGSGYAVMLCGDCNGTGHNLRGVLPPLPETTIARLSRPVVATFNGQNPIVLLGQIDGVRIDVEIADDQRDALNRWYTDDMRPRTGD